MNKLLSLILLTLIILLIKSFYSDNLITDLKSHLSKDESNITYYNVPQGYFEESLFVSQYYSGIELNFDVIKPYFGKYYPLISLILYSQSRKDSIELSYIAEPNDEHLRLLVKLDGKQDLDEDIKITKSVTQMKLTWKNKNVYINSDDFDHVMNIPFDVTFIAVKISSIETVYKINLFEKNNEN